MTPSSAPIRNECPARLRAIEKRMGSDGLGMLVVLGRGIITQYGYLQYLGGYCPMIRLGALVIRPGRPPVMLLPTPADVALARAQTPVADLRVASVGADGGTRSSLAEHLAALAAEVFDVGTNASTSTPRRIGVVGLGDILIAEEWQRWRDTMPQTEFVAVSSLLKSMKAQKSEQELVELQQAAGIADAGMDALVNALARGGTFRSAAGAAEAELRAQGASEVLVYLSRGPHYRHRHPPGSPNPGDLLTVFVELSNENGYWAEFARLVAVGPLDGPNERLAGHCLESLDLIESLLRPGAVAGEVQAAVADHARQAGYLFDPNFGHGIGLDHDLPNIAPGAESRLAPGMVVSMHPQFLTADQQRGASLGDAFVITPHDARPLSRRARELLRI